MGERGSGRGGDVAIGRYPAGGDAAHDPQDPRRKTGVA
jgi:hypothetical protein